mgnify:FL=1
MDEAGLESEEEEDGEVEGFREEDVGFVEPAEGEEVSGEGGEERGRTEE